MTFALLLVVAFAAGLWVGMRVRDSYWIASSRVDCPRACARGAIYQAVREGDVAKARQVLSDAQRETAEVR